MKTKLRTLEDKQKILEQVRERTKKGDEPKDKILKSLNVSPGTYYAWKRSVKPVKKTKPELLSIDLPNEDAPVTVLLGKSSDIHSILDKLTQIYRG